MTSSNLSVGGYSASNFEQCRARRHSRIMISHSVSVWLNDKKLQENWGARLSYGHTVHHLVNSIRNSQDLKQDFWKRVKRKKSFVPVNVNSRRYFTGEVFNLTYQNASLRQNIANGHNLLERGLFTSLTT